MFSENNESKPNLYVEYQVDGKIFKAHGSPDEVNKHTQVFLSIVASDRDNAIQMRLPEVIENNPEAQPTAIGYTSGQDSSGVKEISNINNKIHDTPDLISLYRKSQVKNQKEGLTLITYYYQELLGNNSVTMDNFHEAFDILADIPIQKPANISARLKECKDLIRVVDRGCYRLTVVGTEAINKILE